MYATPENTATPPRPGTQPYHTTSPYLESDVEQVRSGHKRHVLRSKNAFPPNQLHGTRDDLPPATRRAMNPAQRVIVVIVYSLEHHREEVGFGHIGVRLVCPEISEGVPSREAFFNRVRERGMGGERGMEVVVGSVRKRNGRRG